MKDQFITKISNKFGWSDEESTQALDIYLDDIPLYKDKPLYSIEEKLEILNICFISRSPNKRFNDVLDYLLKLINDENILGFSVINTLFEDEVFGVIAFFNLFDYVKSKLSKKEKEYFLEVFELNRIDRSFKYFVNITQTICELSINPDFIGSYEYLGNYEIDSDKVFLTSPDQMAYKFVDKSLRKILRVEEKGVDFGFDPDDLLGSIVKETGLRVFNIEMFRYFANLESWNTFNFPAVTVHVLVDGAAMFRDILFAGEREQRSVPGWHNHPRVF